MATVSTPPIVAAPDRRAVVDWVLYDLANVVFAIHVVSLCFPLWVVNLREPGHYAGLFAMVGRFSAILGPLLWAAEVDRFG